MRKTILAALAAAAVAAILSIGMPAQRAAAMAPAAPTERGIATGHGGLVQKAAFHHRHSGYGREWRDQYWGWGRHYWGWPLPAFWVRPWGCGWRYHHWHHWHH